MTCSSVQLSRLAGLGDLGPALERRREGSPRGGLVRPPPGPATPAEAPVGWEHPPAWPRFPRTTTRLRTMSSRAVAASPGLAAAPRNTARRNQRGPSIPVNRAGWRAPEPSDALTCARSSTPKGPRLLHQAARLVDRRLDLTAHVVPQAAAARRGVRLHLDRGVGSREGQLGNGACALVDLDLDVDPRRSVAPAGRRDRGARRRRDGLTSDSSHGPFGRRSTSLPFTRSLPAAAPPEP